MTAIFGSFMETAIKFLVFLAIALGGIVCGKKYRDHKDAGKAGDVIAETK
ncbi:MAG: hypothetical protein QM657_16020 [Lacrimispora sp.]